MENNTLWSRQAWKASEHIYNAILELPFIKELSAGTLDASKFENYIRQDNLYITEYSRVLAHIASRLPEFADMETFLGFSLDGVAVEKGLHSMYVSEVATEMSPECLFYTSLLKAQALEDVAVEVAAILPCFWIYLEVGKHVLRTAKMEGNPYADWIKCYSDPAFDESTAKCIAIADKLAANASEEVRQQMTRLYVECARQEWLFWESAYRMSRWEKPLI